MGRFAIACVLALAVLAGGGCSPSPPFSAVFIGIDKTDLRATATRCRSATSITWGDVGGGEGIDPIRKFKFWQIACPPETLDPFLQELKDELQQAVEDFGGKLTDTIVLDQEGTKKANHKIGVARKDAVELKGVRLSYVSTATRGEVLATVAKLEPGADDGFPYLLIIAVVEPISERL